MLSGSRTRLRQMLHLLRLHTSWTAAGIALTICEVLIPTITIFNVILEKERLRGTYSFGNSEALFPLYDWGGQGAESHVIPEFRSVTHSALPSDPPRIVMWLAVGSALQALQPGVESRVWEALGNRTDSSVVELQVLPPEELQARLAQDVPFKGSFREQRVWSLQHYQLQWAVFIGLESEIVDVGGSKSGSDGSDGSDAAAAAPANRSGANGSSGGSPNIGYTMSQPNLNSNMRSVDERDWQKSYGVLLYHNTHFLSLQSAVESTIDEAVFGVRTAVNASIFRYPTTPAVDKGEVVTANIIFSLIVPFFGVLCSVLFAIPSVRMTAALVNLRASGTQKYLQINGMSNTAYYLSFLISVVLPRLLFVPVFSFILVAFFFPHVGVMPFAAMMMLYLITLVPFAALTSLVCANQLSAWFVSFGVYIISTAAGLASSGCGETVFPIDRGICFSNWYLFPPLPPITFVQAMAALAQNSMKPYHHGHLVRDIPHFRVFYVVLLAEGFVCCFAAWWISHFRLRGYPKLSPFSRKWGGCSLQEDNTGLHARDVCVYIKGRQILHNVSIDVASGDKVALLGHNGAGKTTCIRVVTGSLPYSGDITLCGLPIREACSRGHVGYCPQDEVLPDLTVRQLLELSACFRGVHLREVAARAEAVADQFGLSDFAGSRLKLLSLGIRKKAAVAVAFMGKPKLVILDEPTAGLDPRSCKDIWQVARSQRDVAILFTTHLLDEAAISDRIALMHAGTLPPHQVGSMSELKERFDCGHRLVILKKNASVENTEILLFVNKYIPVAWPDADDNPLNGGAAPGEAAPGDGGRELVIPLPFRLGAAEGRDGILSLSKLVNELQKDLVCAQLDVESFSLRKSGLEEAMVRLTDPCAEGDPSTQLDPPEPHSSASGDKTWLQRLWDRVKGSLPFCIRRRLPSCRSAAGGTSGTQSNESLGGGEAQTLSVPLLVSDAEATEMGARPLSPAELQEGRNFPPQEQDFEGGSFGVPRVSGGSGAAGGASRKLHSGKTLSTASTVSGPAPSLLCGSAAFLSIAHQILVMMRYMKLPSMLGSGRFLVFQSFLPLFVVCLAAPLTQMQHPPNGSLPPVPIYTTLKDTQSDTIFFINAEHVPGSNGTELLVDMAQALHRSSLDGGGIPLRVVQPQKNAVLLNLTGFSFNSTVRETPFVIAVRSCNAFDANDTVSAGVEIWFNATVVHSLPYAMNYIHNIVREVEGKPPVIAAVGRLPELSNLGGSFWAYLIFFAVSVSLSMGMFTGKLVKERATGARFLTQLCGVHDTVFYIAYGISDAIGALGVTLICFFYTSMFSPRLRSPDVLSCYLLLFFEGIPATLACNYTLSYAFKNSLLATVVTTCYHLVLSGMCIDYFDRPHPTAHFRWLSPLSVVSNAMVYLQAASGSIVDDMNEHPQDSTLELCKPHLLTLLYQMIIWSFLLMLCESGYKVKNAVRWCFPRPSGYYEREAVLADIVQDSSVSQERQAVERALRKLEHISRKPASELTVDEAEVKNSLVVEQLRKIFGKHVAVSGMYLLLRPGDCFGLLSPPGGGKSTLLRMVAGLLSPSQGEVTTRGFSNLRPLQLKKLQKLCGYLPETDPLPPELTVMQSLEYYARLKGIPGVSTESLEELLRYVGLHEKARRKCGSLSGGAKRLLALTIVLLGNPSILLLDNPTSAMDPQTRDRAWRLIMSRIRPNLHAPNSSARPIVFMSTGSLREAESICTRFGIMVDGHLTTIGTPKQLKDRLAKGYFVNVYFTPPRGGLMSPEQKAIENCARALVEELAKLSPKAELLESGVGRRQVEVQLPLTADLAELLRLLVRRQQEYGIDEFSVSKTSFEQAYLRAVELQQKANLKKRDRTAQQVVPPLKICILVVGSRGDVQPFIALALRLRECGHTVRIGTHECFRGFIQSKGFDFFPIGGDPEKLMRFMVENPSMLTTSLKAIRENRAMMSDIFTGCWLACESFSPDVIIANPPVQVHVHIAEALHVPLQIHFTMPWSPTKAYLHPLAAVSALGNEQSYLIVEELLWLGMSDLINNFRSAIGLPRARGGAGLQHTLKIPHVYCVSESLVPKPADWGSHITTCGFWFLSDTPQQGTAPAINIQAKLQSLHMSSPMLGSSSPGGPCNSPADCDAPPELASFIAGQGPATLLVYIGFGSIVIPDRASFERALLDGLAMLRDALLAHDGVDDVVELDPSHNPLRDAAQSLERIQRHRGQGTPLRVILHAGWAALGSGSNLPDYVFALNQPVSHDWIFPKCSVLVHHGGAGTTAAGLRAGKPTVIIPFFGDQPFWGECCERQGVGPPPIHRKDLTARRFCDALLLALRPATLRNAEDLGSVISSEAGVEKGARAFHSYLPLDFEGRWRVSAFENQRWFPVVGWSATLAKGDPSPFSDDSGLRVVCRERFPCPEGWIWETDWEVVTTPDTDAEGFQFATSFKGPWKRSTSSRNVVRRRAWVRRRSYVGNRSHRADSQGHGYLNLGIGLGGGGTSSPGAPPGVHPGDVGSPGGRDGGDALALEMLRAENARLQQRLGDQTRGVADLLRCLSEGGPAGVDNAEVSQLCAALSASIAAVGKDTPFPDTHTALEAAVSEGCVNVAELLASASPPVASADPADAAVGGGGGGGGMCVGGVGDAPSPSAPPCAAEADMEGINAMEEMDECLPLCGSLHASLLSKGGDGSGCWRALSDGDGDVVACSSGVSSDGDIVIAD